jgi:pantetheine-phosphate adenylyltransferase
MTNMAMFPGTFDPITLGHVSVAERALKIVDKVVVAVYTGDYRKRPLFSAEQRVEMARVALHHLGDRVTVEPFDGLLVNFASTHGIRINIRGVRCAADFESELRMSYINGKLNHDIETILIPASDQHRYISSTLVREVASLGGDPSQFVPPNVSEALRGVKKS